MNKTDFSKSTPCGGCCEVISDNNSFLMKYFHAECKAHGAMNEVKETFEYLNRFPEHESSQLSLF